MIQGFFFTLKFGGSLIKKGLEVLF